MVGDGTVVSPQPLRSRWYIAAVIGLGALAVVGGLGLATGTQPLGRVVAVVGILAVCYAVRLPVRIQDRRVLLTCGELALVVSVVLVPLAWLPPLVLAGVLVGHLLSAAPPVRLAFNAALVTVSVTAAAGVAHLLGVSPASGLTMATVAGVVVAAAVYVALSFVLTGFAVPASGASAHRMLLTRAAPVKALMFVGNVGFALGIVAVGSVNLNWLVLAPPLLWLLHDVYRTRLRVGEERWLWRELSAVTARLNETSDRSVVEAAIRGVTAMLAPESVEIVVATRTSARRRYVAGRDGEVAEVRGAAPSSAGVDSDATIVTSRLAVGRQRVGELRLSFGPGVDLTRAENHALSVFGDALAAALYNAIAHGRLGALVSRTSRQAEHDPLTGLANRGKLLEYGETALRDLAESGRSASVGLLLFDLNHFKDINDPLGHAAGDELLRRAARRLGAATAPGELLARLGGDEFALLITSVPETASPVEHAACRGRQLAAELATPTEVAGVALAVEVSIGVVTVPAGSCEVAELLRRADVAMYQAKRSGRTVAVYDNSKDLASTDRLALLAELREALAADDQLVLVLQPAVDLETGAPIGAEALIRWHHPRRGLLAPAEFIGVVEKSELIGPFTRYVLDRALTVAAEWTERGIDVPVAVNLSARSLLDRQLPAELAELLARHGQRPGRLVLEITETVMMTELEIIDEVLTALRELGVQLAVDDFGTGYSSLTFLARFAVDEVKVDRAFVTRMIDSAEAAAIVRTTVELAHALGLRVVAEGVETAEQRAALAAIGCTAGQGYHFFPPIPAEKAGAVLHALHRAAEKGQIIPLARGAGDHA